MHAVTPEKQLRNLKKSLTYTHTKKTPRSDRATWNVPEKRLECEGVLLGKVFGFFFGSECVQEPCCHEYHSHHLSVVLMLWLIGVSFSVCSSLCVNVRKVASCTHFNTPAKKSFTFRWAAWTPCHPVTSNCGRVCIFVCVCFFCSLLITGMGNQWVQSLSSLAQGWMFACHQQLGGGGNVWSLFCAFPSVGPSSALSLPGFEQLFIFFF